MLMNLRGVKESVAPLVPIFLLFLVTHAFAIVYALGVARSRSSARLSRARRRTFVRRRRRWGPSAVFVLIMRAYSMGAGTYTGIEAVSNGLPILREPRVQTAKRTMRYMAASLAFMAVGLMIGYLLFGVTKVPGKTLNAVLMERIAAGWGAPGVAFVLVTLVSEAVLLFVAAQTGFLDGPRVLANMSLDRWLPSQFSLLSERLVIKNGILLMGGAALVVLIVQQGARSRLLVVLYAINVFITFCLSQAGHGAPLVEGAQEAPLLEAQDPHQRLRSPPHELHPGVAGRPEVPRGRLDHPPCHRLARPVAIVIKRFYFGTGRRLARLDHLMTTVATAETESPPDAHGSPARPGRLRFDPKAKTAVILVSGFNGTGLHTLFSVRKVFGNVFRNWFFIQAGIVDADRFKGAEGIDQLRTHVETGLDRYVRFLKAEGMFAQGFSAVGTDVSDEICGLAQTIYEKHPTAVFFGGQIVFVEDTFLTRLLFNHTTFAVQRRLHQQGYPSS